MSNVDYNSIEKAIKGISEKIRQSLLSGDSVEIIPSPGEGKSIVVTEGGFVVIKEGNEVHR